MNTGEKSKIRTLDEETIAWTAGPQEHLVTVSKGVLLVPNAQENVPSWLSKIEFRKASPVDVSEMIRFAGSQNRSILQQFADVRRNAREKSMLNDARQIGAACQQVMMVDNVAVVEFDIDSSTGEVSGKIKEYVPKISKGTKAVNGRLTMGGTFSLVNPEAFDGKPVTFSEEGKFVK